jgi:acetylornithine deacetylase/succinyl-diaminopimelate desuccinylase-like protein
MRRTYVAPILAMLAIGGRAEAADSRAAIDAYVQAHQKDIIDQLDTMVRIESVAANPAGLTQQAAMLEDELRARGFAAKQVVEGGSPPLVFGALKAKGARRTVIFYAHYDGQPVTPSQWASPPFDPVMRGGPLSSQPVTIDWRAAKTLDPEWRLFGRATSDDKAGIVAFLAAFDALKATGQRPNVNIKVVWEGEEEAGSPHLRALLVATPHCSRAMCG